MTIFLNNKYTRWYWALIKKRAITDDNVRGEIHHIIPRSLGGTDTPDNLVKLSGHDHAWCHWLLTKITEGESKAKMIYAFNMMGVYGEHMDRQKSYAIVRAYERNRLEWSKTHSENMKGKEPWNKGLKLDDEKYKKAGRSNKGRVLAPEIAEAKRLRQIGRKMSHESSEKKRQSMTGFVRGPMSEEEKEKRSKATLGIPKKHGDKIAAANRGLKIINKDGKEKRVKEEHLQMWYDNGWAKGRALREAKKRGPYKKKLST